MKVPQARTRKPVKYLDAQRPRHLEETKLKQKHQAPNRPFSKRVGFPVTSTTLSHLRESSIRYFLDRYPLPFLSVSTLIS